MSSKRKVVNVAKDQKSQTMHLEIQPENITRKKNRTQASDKNLN
jgi:hypothetical protein